MGNWGLLEKEVQISFAPIYDCGSSLGALLDDEMMEENLKVPWKLQSLLFLALMGIFLARGRVKELRMEWANGEAYSNCH